MSAIRTNLIRAVENFLCETGISADRLGRDALGDHKFYAKLRRGNGTTLRTLEKVETYMASERARRAAGDVAAP